MLDDVVVGGGGGSRSNSGCFEVFSPKNKSDVVEMGKSGGISVTMESSGISGAALIDNTRAREKIMEVH